MIANVNEKGRQTKLLAAIAVLAMVICTFAVVMPSDVSAADTPPVAPTSFDGEIDAVGDFANLTAGDYRINNSITIDDSDAVPIPKDVRIFIVDGGYVSVESTAGTIDVDGEIYVMSGGAVSYAKEITGDGSIFVCYGATVTGPVDGDDIGATGDLRIENDQGYIVMKMIENNGRSLEIHGSVQSVKSVVGMNDTVNVVDGATLSGTFSAETGKISANAVSSIGDKKTYYGTAKGEELKADGDYYTLFNGTAKITYGTNSVTLTNIVSTEGITVSKTSTYEQMTISGTVGTATAGTTMSIDVNGVLRTGTGGLNQGDAAMDVVTSGMLTGDGIIVSDSFSGITGVAPGAKSFRVYGDIQNDVTFTDTTTVAYIMPGSSFDGSVAYTVGGTTTTFFDGAVAAGTTEIKMGYTAAVQDTSPAKVTLTSNGGITFGNITVSNIVELGDSTDSTLPSGYTMSFGPDGELEVGTNTYTIGGDLYAANPDKTQITGTTGTVETYSTNVAFVEQYTSLDVNTWTSNITTAQEFIDAVESGSKDIVIGSSGTPANIVLGTGCDVDYLELDGVKVTVYGTITVGGTEDFSLVISNRSTITDGSIGTAIDSMGTNSITVKSGSSMEIDTSYLYINVKAVTGSTITSINNQYSSGSNIPGSVMVGFGSEYTLTGAINNNQYIKVWGTLIVPENGTLDVSEGAVVSTASGAVVNVIGEMTVSGTVNIADEVTFDVDGTVNVSNTNGNAKFNNNGKVVVDGTFNVSAPNTGRPANILNAGTDFTVNGSMVMAGTLEGTVADKGEVTINGTSDSAKIYVYDGVTLQITSVVGELKVSDKDVAKDIYGDSSTSNGYRSNVSVTDGNMIKLRNGVNGVSISVAITSEIKDNVRYVYTDMFVSGTITLDDDENETEGIVLGTDGVITPVNKRSAQIFIDDSVVLGKSLQMTVADGQKVTVNGTVTATAEKSSFVNEGTVTVNGTITFGKDAKDGIANTNINAVTYTVTDTATGDKTITYTNFADALNAADDADRSTIYVYGTVKATVTDTVTNGQNVQITGTLEISKDAVLTVENGGKVSGGSSTITVYGTFTSANFLGDISVRTINADVIVDEAPARTYTSLSNALAGAGEGDVITLNGPVQITENMTIPVGATVKSDYNVNIRENVVLTVAGTLDISAKGSVSNDPSSEYDSETDRLGTVAVSGTVAVIGDSEPAMLANVSGAHYSKSVGAIDTYYVSSLEIAAQNVDENISQTIFVKGTVSADAVTFTKPEALGSLTISIQDVGTSTDDNRTVVAVGTMTLSGAILSVADGTTYSGDVTASAADATATVNLNRAGNINVASIGVETAEGVTDYLTIWSASGTLDGAVSITEGTVTVASINGSSLAAGSIDADGESTVLTVESGTTLTIRNGSSVTAGYTGTAYNHSAGMIVNGTVDVKGSMTVDGQMDLNGTMTVSESTETTGLSVTGTLNVLGTLDVSTETGKEGRAVVSYIMTVGAKPTVLGQSTDGTVNGAVNITNTGIVKVYSGTVGDLTLDGIEASNTAVYINGTQYMTVYGSGSMLAIIINDEVELSGLTTPTAANMELFSDAECKNEVTSPMVGNYEAVYMKFNASYVYGTVSEGNGFTLFIDGVPAASYAAGSYPLSVGNHIISYDMVVGYSGENAQLTFNGQTIESGATITITADMDSFNITVTGAVPADINGGSTGSSDGMGLTDYLLIVLVVLIVIMAIMVALRLMRS